MKTKIILMAALVGSVGFVGCAKQHGPGAQAPSKDTQIHGQWKLASPGAVTAAGLKAPQALKFEVNRNGLNEANYCQLDGISGGSGYEVKGDELTVTYYSFESVGQLGQIPNSERKFVSKITQLSADSMVLDGQVAYERISVASDASLNCEEVEAAASEKQK